MTKAAVKKIDGRSKEARALRAKQAASGRVVKAAKQAGKRGRPAKIVGTSVDINRPDHRLALRIHALNIANSNVERDKAARDLVPLARLIESFLIGEVEPGLIPTDWRAVVKAANLETGGKPVFEDCVQPYGKPTSGDLAGFGQAAE